MSFTCHANLEKIDDGGIHPMFTGSLGVKTKDDDWPSDEETHSMISDFLANKKPEATNNKSVKKTSVIKSFAPKARDTSGRGRPRKFFTKTVTLREIDGTNHCQLAGRGRPAKGEKRVKVEVSFDTQLDANARYVVVDGKLQKVGS